MIFTLTKYAKGPNSFATAKKKKPAATSAELTVFNESPPRKDANDSHNLIND